MKVFDEFFNLRSERTTVNLVFESEGGERERKRERESNRVETINGGRSLTRVERHETLMQRVLRYLDNYANSLSVPVDAIGTIFHA